MACKKCGKPETWGVAIHCPDRDCPQWLYGFSRMILDAECQADRDEEREGDWTR